MCSSRYSNGLSPLLLLVLYPKFPSVFSEQSFFLPSFALKSHYICFALHCFHIFGAIRGRSLDLHKLYDCFLQLCPIHFRRPVISLFVLFLLEDLFLHRIHFLFHCNKIHDSNSMHPSPLLLIVEIPSRSQVKMNFQ